MLSGVKTVLSKIDTGSIERCSGYRSAAHGWVARSPDMISDMVAEQSVLNPIDYAVCGILQECVHNHHRITDVEELRQRAEEEWDHLDQ